MKLYTFLISGLILGLSSGCHGTEHDHDSEKEHSEQEHKADSNLVEMTHEAAKSAGITTETVAASDFNESVKAAGFIENSRGGERIVSAPASGIVSFSSGIVAGQAVKAGQPLFSISSKGLEQSDATSTIHVDVEAARTAYERAAQLIKDNLITRPEYDRLRADYDRAKAVAATVGAKTARAVGVSAPMSGFLVDVSVAPGAFVNMGDPLATVATDRRLLLRAEVSEHHRNFARSVSGANIRVPGQELSVSLASLAPKILSSAPTASANSNFFPVYIEFDNPGGLSNGSVVEVWLAGNTRHGVISVPNSALVEEGGYFYVYVKQPDEHELFRKTEVKTGSTDGMRTEIISGLSEGETVVTQGALRIRMAGMGSSIQGHTHHH
ncbi:MAG: efflux RND transporter periplasmic adaptor subunit [Bacteroidales bacterium]|nr:efflux RND transporter periplasmic adaptor subunit [Bacteroidales bacterium]